MPVSFDIFLRFDGLCPRFLGMKQGLDGYTYTLHLE